MKKGTLTFLYSLNKATNKEDCRSDPSGRTGTAFSAAAFARVTKGPCRTLDEVIY